MNRLSISSGPRFENPCFTLFPRVVVATQRESSTADLGLLRVPDKLYRIIDPGYVKAISRLFSRDSEASPEPKLR